jgi:hypothetical protein
VVERLLVGSCRRQPLCRFNCFAVKVGLVGVDVLVIYLHQRRVVDSFHDRSVCGDLALKAAQRFLFVCGEEAADIRTSAAGDAHYIRQLGVRLGAVAGSNAPGITPQCARPAF